MTISVSSAPFAGVHPHARKRRPVGTAPSVPAWTTIQLPSAATPPVAAPAPAPAPAAPTGPVGSPEYDDVDPAGVVGDISSGVAGEFLAPPIKVALDHFLNAEQFPFLGSEYGKVIPGKIAGAAIGQVSGAVGAILGDALRGALYGKVPGVGEGEPGLGWTPTPPNKLVGGVANGIGKAWLNLAVRQALAPPPPPPAPVYPPGVEPLPPVPGPTPPPPKLVLGQPIRPILHDAAMGVVGMGINAIYDQTVGPLVQRAANIITGHGADEIKKPTPLTPGSIVNGFVDSVLSTLLIRSVSFPEGPPPSGGMRFAGALGASIANGILGAAWSTVYGRGVGPAIENGVNQLAGLRPQEEQAAAKLPALEHFTRAATRGVAVGATTYLLGNALNATMVHLGASIGGVGGALVGMAGAALIGAIGGTAVDATIGPMLGKLGGQIYSWLSGKPAYEQRMQEAAQAPAPGPTPGDPVKAPNGNPGTVPAPSVPAAPAASPIAAPAMGKPRARRKTGMPAVDRTSPAIGVLNTKLVALALKG